MLAKKWKIQYLFNGSSSSVVWLFAIAIAIQSYRLSFPFRPYSFPRFCRFSRSIFVAIFRPLWFFPLLFICRFVQHFKAAKKRESVCLWEKRFFIYFVSDSFACSAPKHSNIPLSHSFEGKIALFTYHWIYNIYAVSLLFDHSFCMCFILAIYMETAGNFHHF